MSYDVIVIGGGLSGAMAALKAKERYQNVALLHQTMGVTALSSGAFQFLARRDRRISVQEAWNDLLQKRPYHPYRLSHLAEMDQSFQFMIEKLGLKGKLSDPLPYLNEFGTFQRAEYTLPSHQHVTPHFWQGKRVMICGLSSYANFDLKYLTHIVENYGAQQVLGATIPFELEFNLPSYVVAQQIEKRFQEFLEALKSCLTGDVDLLIVPPVCGLKRSFVPDIERELGIQVSETLALHSSVAGQRLQRLMEEGIKNTGVEPLVGVAISVRSDQKGHAISYRRGNDAHVAEAEGCIVATGKYISQGIKKGRFFEETLFGLPLSIDGKQVTDQFSREFLDENFFHSQPLMMAGVLTDSRFRPISVDGNVLGENLWCCGSLLGGYDPAVDGCRAGVAILSGFKAGQMT